MKNILIGLFLLFTCLIGFNVQASKIPYLAIAGPGKGAGMMGHAFIVFANQRGQFLDAEAYQYGIRFPDDFEFTPAKALKLSHFPFIVTKLPAWNFIKNYNSEGRYVHLFELQLSHQQVVSIQKSLEEDLKARESLQFFDYSVQSSNCITKLYDQLNKVILNKKHKFNYSSPATAAFTLSFLRPSVVAATIPLAAAANVSTHPLVGNTIKFRSAEMLDLETNLVGITYLKNLFEQCSVSENTRKVILDIYGNKALRQTNAYLDLLSGLFSDCASQNRVARDEFNFHLDFLRYQSSNHDFIELAAQYYLN